MNCQMCIQLMNERDNARAEVGHLTQDLACAASQIDRLKAELASWQEGSKHLDLPDEPIDSWADYKREKFERDVREWKHLMGG